MCIVIRVSETQSLSTAMAGWTGDQLRLYVHLKRRLVLDVVWEYLRGTCGTGHRAQWLHGVPLTAWVELGQGSVRIILTSVGFDGSPTPPGGYRPDDTLKITNRAAFLLRRRPAGIWILEQIYGEPLFEPGDTWVPNGRLELNMIRSRHFAGLESSDIGHGDEDIAWLDFMANIKSMTHVKSMTRIALSAPVEYSIAIGGAKKEGFGRRAERIARKLHSNKISASTTEESASPSENSRARGRSVACHAHDAIRINVSPGGRAAGSAGSSADRVAANTMPALISPIPYGLAVRARESLENTRPHVRSLRAGENSSSWAGENSAASFAKNQILGRGEHGDLRDDFMADMGVWRGGLPDGTSGMLGADLALH